MTLLLVRGLQAAEGSYHSGGTHHGKTFYTKDGESDGFIYFWDARDGPLFQGWWMSSCLGAAPYWASHPSIDDAPPSANWYVGSNINLDVQIVYQTIEQGPSTLCCFRNENGTACVNPKPASAPWCIRNMCNYHCRSCFPDCPRHAGEWQGMQNTMPRSQRAPRRRGGQRSQGSNGPY